MREVWIVKGKITDEHAHPGGKLGDIEYQFSDGPPGQRSHSADYLSLEDGLKDHEGYLIHLFPVPK